MAACADGLLVRVSDNLLMDWWCRGITAVSRVEKDQIPSERQAACWEKYAPSMSGVRGQKWPTWKRQQGIKSNNLAL